MTASAPTRGAANSRRRPMDPTDPYAAWLGRTEERRDTVTATPVAALAATLDRDDPAPVPGTALPPLWHWLYFLPLARQSEIGPDGHPRRGGFLPPVELPRRMWAGGRLSFLQPLRVGDPMTRTSRIASIACQAGALRAARLRHRRARDRDRGRRRAARGARHRLPRAAGAGRDRDPGRGADRRDLRAQDRSRRRPALSLFGAHLQRPPHPLRPALRHRGRGLSGPDRARPADRHAARRPAAARASRRGRCAASTSRRSARSSTCTRSPSAAAPTASRRFALWARSAEGALAMQATAEIA